MRRGLVVLVHGLFSSAETWDPLLALLQADPELTSEFDFRTIEYPSGKIQFNFLKRIPDVGTIADRLRTELDHITIEYERVVLVGHSMGGLIILRYLAMMIAEQRGMELRKVRSVVTLATPNEGSDILIFFRESASWWRHPQEQELRKFNSDVMEARFRVVHSIVEATNAAADRCPIPIAAYAGQEDNVVKSESARSSFRLGGTLPGDHFTIHVPSSSESITYRIVKDHLLDALRVQLPVVADTIAARPRDDVYTEMCSFPPVLISFCHHPVQFQVHAGPINQVRDIDIVVSSENVNYDIAKPFKPSTSGRLRLAVADKNEAGDIVQDVMLEEINAWMRKNGKLGLSVTKGTVAPTSSGAMLRQGIKRIYHAAIVEPVSGSNDYTVSTQTILDGVHSVFDVARAEREDGGELVSIGFPLFGAGRGRLNYEVSFETMWTALTTELARDPSWSIHFCTWTYEETRFVLDQLTRLADATT